MDTDASLTTVISEARVLKPLPKEQNIEAVILLEQPSLLSHAFLSGFLTVTQF
jgi:hypothetical protein